MATDIGIFLGQLTLLLGLGFGPGLLVWRWSGLGPPFAAICVWAGTSLVAFALFWTWFVSPGVAILATRVSLAISVALAAVLISRSRAPSMADVWFPLALMAGLGAACLLVKGAYPTSAAHRFGVPLPGDDALPRMLADRVQASGTDWRAMAATLDGHFATSDRPPLQAAVVLANRAVAPSYRLADYQTTATICQVAIVPALWAFCAAMGYTRRQRAFVLIGTCFSGFVLLHAIYVWPKLLSGALLLAGVAVLLDSRAGEAGAPSTRRAVLAGGLAGLSLLAHGGTAFSIVMLPALLVWRWGPRALLGRRGLSLGVAMFLVISPWLAYQRLVAPPGDRLLKIHLAGVMDVDSRPFLVALSEQYSALSAGDLVSIRVRNLREQWLTPAGGSAPDARTWIQWQQFYHAVPALDTLAIGLLVVAWRRGRGGSTPRCRESAVLAYALLSWLFWIAVMFSPGTALVHHGSFTTMLLLLALGGAGLARLRGWLGIALLTVHLTIFAFAWLTVSGSAFATPRPSWLYVAVATMLLLGLSMALAPIDGGSDRHSAGGARHAVP